MAAPRAASVTPVVDIRRSAATLNQMPSLVEVQTLLNRVPSLKQIAKVPSLNRVPSLIELNARATADVHVSLPAHIAAAKHAMPPPPPVLAAAGAAGGADGRDGDAAPAPGRVCAHCRTQKTPLWRNGPLGPKSLCNACGVRHKLGKLPPPGGFPPGHVPTPAPPRKRPVVMLTAGSGGNPLKRQKVSPTKKGGAGGNNGKQQTERAGAGVHNANYAARSKIPAGKRGPNGAILTDYDGAVLLMVLAGMYSN
jgi:hypothetical protein